MKPEQQRIAIAEACGITDCHRVIELWRPAPNNVRLEGIMGGNKVTVPDYLNDLNAMYEAEKVLRADQLADYFDRLCHQVIDGSLAPAGCVWHATAAQRAEAFLRTLSLWTP